MRARTLFTLPRRGLCWMPIWRRNFLVWRKLAIPALLGNLADPLIYMLGLGYGLGGLLPQVNGVSYVSFLAAGTMFSSTMNAATFEALYSAFSRMHVQKTWDAILNTPRSIDDVLAGELVWAASKSLLSDLAILIVIAALGITPMTLISGVFFPADQLPAALRIVADCLPLSHAVQLTRPLLLGEVPGDIGLHVGVLLLIALAAFSIATVLTRRRLLKWPTRRPCHAARRSDFA